MNLRKLAKFLVSAFVVLLFHTPYPGNAENSYLQTGGLLNQLATIARFDNLQNPDDSTKHSDIRVINNFVAAVTTLENQDSEVFADNLIGFCELALQSGNTQEVTVRTSRVLHFFGRAQYFRHSVKETNLTGKHFTRHVIEAIKTNKVRSKFYSELSGGNSQSLTRLYIAMEYSILPVAMIMDAWAYRFQKAGVPVMANDFVSMDHIQSPFQPLMRNGAMNAQALESFTSMITNFRKETRVAANNKDFAMVQFHAIQALTNLRSLEKQHNCNLSLSIHLIESIGLAARNAATLSKAFNGQTDNFYRAFIVLQNIGVGNFSRIDVKAQKFHQAGIGIITNDLPAIPFP